jgi:hypothetical protein
MAEATKVGFQLASSLASQHLTDAEFIKGGYLVIDSLSKITPGSPDYLPVADGDNDGIIVEGSLCYCTVDSKFYQYNNGTWAEKDFGTKTEASTSNAGLMSPADKQKLNNIAPNAEVNVQADWNETSSSSDAYIKNKPMIPTIIISSEDPDAGTAGDVWFKY